MAIRSSCGSGSAIECPLRRGASRRIGGTL